MTQYRRVTIPGARYFFTVNLARRNNNDPLVKHIELLRRIFRQVQARHPFQIDAIVILPEHLHCIWRLPAHDAEYKTRWALIKAGFSRVIPASEVRTTSGIKRGERGIWQRRFWEHMIRDDEDFRRHVEYIH